MRKGRKLELLVKEIEALKLPDATIKSPEFVKDTDTNTLREVDIGIHYSSGGKDFFIALECRDRGALQDIAWIEQLISKKNSVEADVLIAVTSSSFTAPARIKAFKNGVVLRELKKFNVNEVKKWMDETYIEIHVIRRSINGISFQFKDEITLSKPLNEYTFIFEDIPDQLSLMDLISLLANRDMFLELRDKITKMKGEMKGKIDFAVNAKPNKNIYINIPPEVRITGVSMELIAENIFLKAPLVSGFNYFGCEDDSLVAEGFSYKLGQDDVFSSILIDSQTNKAKGELDFSQLTRITQNDIIASITFKYTKPIIVTNYSIKT
jgi:hypothetical protein